MQRPYQNAWIWYLQLFTPNILNVCYKPWYCDHFSLRKLILRAYRNILMRSFGWVHVDFHICGTCNFRLTVKVDIRTFCLWEDIHTNNLLHGIKCVNLEYLPTFSSESNIDLHKVSTSFHPSFLTCIGEFDRVATGIPFSWSTTIRKFWNETMDMKSAEPIYARVPM